MRFALPALALASLCACGPASGTPDAGGGSACTPAKNPPNLLANPGFDCAGKEAEWGGIYGDYATVPGRTGNAGQITVTGTMGGRFGTPVAIATATKHAYYCATAWMKGTTPNAELHLSFEDGTGQKMVSFISADWIRLPPSTVLSVQANPGQKLQVSFWTKDAKVGDTLIVDDVDVWESSDWKCPESRDPVAH